MSGGGDGRVTSWLERLRHAVRMSRTTPRALGVLLLLGVAAGCGSAPDRYEPTGVDELEIPLASPDPDDFVDEIDNELLPLAPGSEWIYRTVSGDRVTVHVTDETRQVAGVTTVVIQVDGTDEWYAQDEAGNVWWFGRDGVWEAGVDGAEAGLTMPAEPRLGDGYAQAHFGNGVEALAEVVDVEGDVTTGYGDFEDVLETWNRTSAERDVVQRRFYAPGVGLIFVESNDGEGDLELVSFTAG